MCVVELEAIPTAIVVSNTTESVELRCEMSGYIEPKINLLWLRNGERITEDSDKYDIRFEEGSKLSIFNGMEALSRVSVLTVLDFKQQNDSGCYECKTRRSKTTATVYVGTEELATGECPSLHNNIQ